MYNVAGMQVYIVAGMQVYTVAFTDCLFLSEPISHVACICVLFVIVFFMSIVLYTSLLPCIDPLLYSDLYYSFSETCL